MTGRHNPRAPVSQTFGELAGMLAGKSALEARTLSHLDETGPFNATGFDRVLANRQSLADLCTVVSGIVDALNATPPPVWDRIVKLAAAADHVVTILEVALKKEPDAEAALRKIGHDLEARLSRGLPIESATLQLASRVERVLPDSHHGSDSFLRAAVYVATTLSEVDPDAPRRGSSWSLDRLTQQEIDYASQRLAAATTPAVFRAPSAYPFREIAATISRASTSCKVAVLERMSQLLVTAEKPALSPLDTLRRDLSTLPTGRFIPNPPQVGAPKADLRAPFQNLLGTTFILIVAGSAAQDLPDPTGLPAAKVVAAMAWHPAFHPDLRDGLENSAVARIDWPRFATMSKAALTADRLRAELGTMDPRVLNRRADEAMATLESTEGSFNGRKLIVQYRFDLARLTGNHDAGSLNRLRVTSEKLAELTVIAAALAGRADHDPKDTANLTAFVTRHSWHPVIDLVEPAVQLERGTLRGSADSESVSLTSFQARMVISRIGQLILEAPKGVDATDFLATGAAAVSRLAPVDSAAVAKEQFDHASGTWQHDYRFTGSLFEKVSLNALDEQSKSRWKGGEPVRPGRLDPDHIEHLERMHTRANLLRFHLSVGSRAAGSIDDGKLFEQAVVPLGKLAAINGRIDTKGFHLVHPSVTVRHPPVAEMLRDAINDTLTGSTEVVRRFRVASLTRVGVVVQPELDTMIDEQLLKVAADPRSREDVQFASLLVRLPGEPGLRANAVLRTRLASCSETEAVALLRGTGIMPLTPDQAERFAGNARFTRALMAEFEDEFDRGLPPHLRAHSLAVVTRLGPSEDKSQLLSDLWLDFLSRPDGERADLGLPSEREELRILVGGTFETAPAVRRDIEKTASERLSEVIRQECSRDAAATFLRVMTDPHEKAANRSRDGELGAFDRFAGRLMLGSSNVYVSSGVVHEAVQRLLPLIPADEHLTILYRIGILRTPEQEEAERVSDGAEYGGDFYDPPPYEY